MFTGIVQGLCRVREVRDEPNLRRFTIDLGPLADGAEPGASIAVNGTCLTVTGVAESLVTFDVIQETLSISNLGSVAVDALVNVERSYRVGDEVGGHILSGHVSDTAELVRVAETDNTRNLFFRVDPRWMKFLHYKGFVALDGASLTIAGLDRWPGSRRASR